MVNKTDYKLNNDSKFSKFQWLFLGIIPKLFLNRHSMVDDVKKMGMRCFCVLLRVTSEAI